MIQLANLCIDKRPHAEIHQRLVGGVWRELQGTAPVRVGLTEVGRPVNVGQDPPRLERPQASVKHLTKVFDDLEAIGSNKIRQTMLKMLIIIPNRSSGVRAVPIMLPPQPIEENPAVRVPLLQEGNGYILQPVQVDNLVEWSVKEQQRQLQASRRHCSNHIHRGRVCGSVFPELVISSRSVRQVVAREKSGEFKK